MKEPLVSICCITYNQEQYVRECLEGFVMQKTNFPFEIVISDDCSKDGTRAVISDYKARYPKLFRDISPEKNMGSMANFLYVQAQAKGKYIALCEGDDYWIDPYKLQKQVDFMDAHPDYSMCLTNSHIKSVGQEERLAVRTCLDTYMIEDVIGCNALNVEQRGNNVVSFGHTSTILYRNPNDEIPDWISKCFIGDEPLLIWLAHFGPAKFINEVMSVYRVGVGMSSKNFSVEKDCKNRIAMYEIIDKGLGGKYHHLIKPVIAEFELRLFKLYGKSNRRMEALLEILKSIQTDSHIVAQWIKRK